MPPGLFRKTRFCTSRKRDVEQNRATPADRRRTLRRGFANAGCGLLSRRPALWQNLQRPRRRAASALSHNPTQPRQHHAAPRRHRPENPPRQPHQRIVNYYWTSPRSGTFRRHEREDKQQDYSDHLPRLPAFDLRGHLRSGIVWPIRTEHAQSATRTRRMGGFPFHPRSRKADEPLERFREEEHGYNIGGGCSRGGVRVREGGGGFPRLTWKV